MVVFSSLKWIFSSDPNDPKHTELLHPLLVCLLGNGVNWVLCSKLSDFFEKKFPQLITKLPDQGKKYLAPFLILYMIAMVTTRYSQQGAYSLYEMLWGCNLAILMFINGLIRNKALPIASTLLLVGIDQSLWYVDIVAYLFTGKFPIGVAKYITWPSTTKLKLLTSTHHVWFLPLVILTLKNLKQYPKYIYFFTYLMGLPMTLIPRTTTPKTLMVNNEEVYLNIMCVYELWKDVKSSVFGAFDKSHPAITTMFSNTGWQMCNILIFVIANFLFPYFHKKNRLQDLNKILSKLIKKNN